MTRVRKYQTKYPCVLLYVMLLLFTDTFNFINFIKKLMVRETNTLIIKNIINV